MSDSDIKVIYDSEGNAILPYSGLDDLKSEYERRIMELERAIEETKTEQAFTREAKEHLEAQLGQKPYYGSAMSNLRKAWTWLDTAIRNEQAKYGVHQKLTPTEAMSALAGTEVEQYIMDEYGVNLEDVLFGDESEWHMQRALERTAQNLGIVPPEPSIVEKVAPKLDAVKMAGLADKGDYNDEAIDKLLDEMAKEAEEGTINLESR